MKKKVSEQCIATGHTNPSEITDSYWLYTGRKKGTYPQPSANSGKWLIFVPISSVDKVWEKIESATERGLLGNSSKVATGRQNPNVKNLSVKVICVYTYDWTDIKDVKRIREGLRRLGITKKIPYKADQETRIGKYATRGDKQISKYYE